MQQRYNKTNKTKKFLGYQQMPTIESKLVKVSISICVEKAVLLYYSTKIDSIGLFHLSSNFRKIETLVVDGRMEIWQS